MRKLKATLAFVTCLLVSTFIIAPAAAFAGTTANADAVATIKSTGETYASLQAAVDAASDDDEIELLTDVTTQVDVYKKSLVIDLGGYTVTHDPSGSNRCVFAFTDGTVALKNGTIDTNGLNAAGEGRWGIHATGTKLTLESVTINSENLPCVYANSANPVNILGCTLTTANTGSAKYTYATVDSNASTINIDENWSGTASTLTVAGNDQVLQTEASNGSAGVINLYGGNYSILPSKGSIGSGYVLYKHAATESEPNGHYQVMSTAKAKAATAHWAKCDAYGKIYFESLDEAKAFAEANNGTAKSDMAHAEVSLSQDVFAYDKTKHTPSTSASIDGVELVEGADYTVTYGDNLEIGTATVKLKAVSDGNYAGSTSITFTITKPNLEAATITLSQTDFTYNGQYQKPTIKSIELNGDRLKVGVDYKTSVTAGKEVGTYEVSATGIYSYIGTITTSYTISPKPAVADPTPKTVTGLKLTKGKRLFKATWTKYTTDRTGVQLRYSTKSSMKGAKTVTIKGAGAKAKTVKKLKKKTRYYVQARSYKVVNGKTYYSNWSAKRTVKTK